MEFNRCSRCGSFYVSTGNVCPKCSQKDGFEFSTFKTYIEENGFENSLDTIANQTGISVQNLNRFVGYPEFQEYKKEYQENLKNGNNDIGFNGITLN